MSDCTHPLHRVAMWAETASMEQLLYGGPVHVYCYTCSRDLSDAERDDVLERQARLLGTAPLITNPGRTYSTGPNVEGA